MSYILEALKKAQAERQLGATPGVHAPTLDSHVAARHSRSLWMPLALGATAVVAVAALALLWRQQRAPHAAVHAGQAIPLARAAELAQLVPSALPTQQAQPVPQVQPVPPAQPVQPEPRQARLMPAADAPAPASRAAQSAPATPPAAAGKSRASTHASAPAATAPVAVARAATSATASATSPAADNTDEVLPFARELPEPIQRSIPTVAMGGYMYSRNPADRLLLVDKVLRHEGEEVAPGLVLDKLLPKAAVFSFRGYRYRVPL